MTGLPWVVSVVAVTEYHTLTGSGAFGVCFDEDYWEVSGEVLLNYGTKGQNRVGLDHVSLVTDSFTGKILNFCINHRVVMKVF